MKVAIMQPYIFPYLGYFQLVAAVDTFVFYDDVNFIKQGWINRNQILVNGKALLFSVPLKDASSFRQINETEVNERLFPSWKVKFMRSLEQSYRKAPYFNEVYPIVQSVFDGGYTKISQMAIASVRQVTSYLGRNATFVTSSGSFPSTKGLDKAERLVAITRALGSTDYINPSGGRGLYQKKYFADQGINLFFMQNHLPCYRQFTNPFISGLSVIDVLMFNDIVSVSNMLAAFELE